MTVNYENLEKAAAFVEKLNPKHFDLSDVVAQWDKGHTCGTVCCVVGYAPKIFPDRCKYAPYDSDSALLLDGQAVYWDDIAKEIFGLADDEITELLTPGDTLQWFSTDAAFMHENDVEYQRDEGVPAKDLKKYRPASPKNVAASIRAFIKFKKTGKKTSARVLEKFA